MRRTVLLLAALALASPAPAAPPEVPTQISYQGVLLDTLGEPRTGNVDLTLRVFDAASGGTLVYKQEFVAVPLTEGVFTLRLGPSGSATDTPDDPLTTDLAEALGGDAGPTAPARFLEVTVGLEGALARTQILTAPYALRAASAETAASAAVADNVTAVNGLDAAVLNQLFQFGNSDGSGPPNTHSAEGLADLDGDGVMNFIDPDNDGDTIPDASEFGGSSDMNLVTPVLDSLVSSSLWIVVSSPVTLMGANFDPTMTVFLDGDPIAATDVTASSARIQPAAGHAVGSFPVHVELANGETSVERLLTFTAVPAPGVALNYASNRTVSVAVQGVGQVVVGNDESYAVDHGGDGSTDTLQSFDLMPDPGGVTPSQIAVAWGADGRLLGLRCVPNGTGCQVQVVRDADEDFVLDGGPGDEVLTGPSYVGTQLRFWGPSLASDASGNVVAGYMLVDDANVGRPTVLHDRNGDQAFAAGAPETVQIQNVTAPPGSLGKLAVDHSGRVAYAFSFQPVAQGPAMRIAYDRNGDGDYADNVAGTPETFNPFGTGIGAFQGRPCGGIAFDGAGRLAVVYAEPSGSAVRLLRDMNGDGDFSDLVDTTTFPGNATSGCDIAGHPTGGLAVVHAGPPQPQLLIDRNSDGDFDDANETQAPFGALAAGTTRLGVTFSGAGRAWVAGHTTNQLFVDPF
jgi:hypothetical protein